MHLNCKYEQYKQNVDDCSHNIIAGYGNKFSPDEILCRRCEDHKKTKDFKASISEKTQISKKSASQHQDQDNFCYRGEECQQANQGQQIIGEDNDAKGFNDQSDNPSALENATGAA